MKVSIQMDVLYVRPVHSSLEPSSFFKTGFCPKLHSTKWPWLHPSPAHVIDGFTPRRARHLAWEGL